MYDFMETNEEMDLSIVKKQINHFLVKKLIEEECKNSSAWWKVHEVQFPNIGFVARQILGIIGFPIELERAFNIVGICTNLRHSQLGIENLEMVMSYIYNNWSNDVCVKGWASMGQFMDMEEALTRENEDLVDKVRLLEIEEIND
jgi:hypothetical protein